MLEAALVATSLKRLIQKQIPFEVALPCLLLIRDPLEEAFSPARGNT